MKDFIEGFKEGQKDFGESIAIIINSVLLFLIYIIGVGLTSIAAKIFNVKFLDLEKNEHIESYWSELNLSEKPIQSYLRQF